MKDYEIKFAIQRANDLAQELLSREENGLKKADAGLIADACARYGAAILVGEAAQDHLDDLSSGGVIKEGPSGPSFVNACHSFVNARTGAAAFFRVV